MRAFAVGMMAALVVGTLGCQSSNGQKQPFGSRLFPGLAQNQQPPAVVAPPAPVATFPGAAPPGSQPYGSPQPYPVQPAAPNGGAFPTAPNSGFGPAPANNNPVPMAPAGPGAGVPSMDSIAQSEHRWQPVPENKVDAKLGPAANELNDDRVLLLPPEPLLESQSEKPTPRGDASPKKQLVPATTFPVGIPQFSPVLDNVSSGLRPALDEGLDWLQAKGYRTVVHVAAAGETGDADKLQVEKRGMRYVCLQVEADTLSKKDLDQFHELIRTTAGHPLFVYDKDGSRAGALWYLHFRVVEQADDEVARIRANSLGLRPDHRDLWTAIERVVNESR